MESGLLISIGLKVLLVAGLIAALPQFLMLLERTNS